MSREIRTVLKDEKTFPSPERERGSRYWMAAEVMSSPWFFLETSVEVDGVNEISGCPSFVSLV